VGLAVLVAALLVGRGGTSHTSLPPSLANLYTYDMHSSLGVRDQVVPNRNIPVVLHTISFSDARGGEVDAYLCVPPGNATFAGVVLVPGSGGRQVDFLIECVQLAAKGAVALSMVTPFIQGTQSGPDATLPSARFYRSQFENSVVAIRRALDLLARRTDVDPRRLGLAGWSLGAALSSVTAGSTRACARPCSWHRRATHTSSRRRPERRRPRPTASLRRLIRSATSRTRRQSSSSRWRGTMSCRRGRSSGP
jgi:hypothetical protein